MDNRYFFFSNCTKRSCQYTFSIDMSTWAIGNHPPPPYKKKRKRKTPKKKKRRNYRSLCNCLFYMTRIFFFFSCKLALNIVIIISLVLPPFFRFKIKSLLFQLIIFLFLKCSCPN